MTDDPLIVRVIHRYHPGWQPPRDTGRSWISCLCPFHAESRSSASVSYEYDAFRCHGCGVKGDAIAIIKSQENVKYADAVRIAEAISPGGGDRVLPKPRRISRARVFGEARNQPGGGRQVRFGVRRGT
ncbi:CHC2 zinc finger domain-containing protein [Nocardia farcinica]|uniref:CHC2 zinc finger domain-containing protein n=1 Tax=Nocardia farcinica TaxID=37329 RepID=UPI000E1B853E